MIRKLPTLDRRRWQESGLEPPADLVERFEEIFFGACLIDVLKSNSNNGIAATGLAVEDFSSRQNQLIWQSILGLVSDGKPVHSVEVWELLGIDLDTLHNWQKHAITNAYLSAWAKTVRRESLKRQAHRALGEDDKAKYLRLTSELASLDEPPATMPVESAVVTVEALSAQTGVQVYPTGLNRLDGQLGGGAGKGQLALIAATPGGGKTAVLIHMAINGIFDGLTVCHVSLEDTALSCRARAVSQVGRIDLAKLLAGKLSPEDLELAKSAAARVDGTPGRWILRDDLPASRFTLLLAELEKIHGENPIDLLLIDYLQLLRDPGLYTSRVEELDGILSAMANFAREKKIALVVAAQFNRDGSAGRPRPHNLKGSSAIEQVAHKIVILERFDSSSREGVQYLVAHCDKVKNGPIGDVFLRWRPQFVLPGDIADDEMVDAQISYDAYNRRRAR